MSVDTENAFFSSVDQARRGAGLFDRLSDICYFAKNREGVFVAVNDALVLLLGKASQEEILGKKDEELVPHYLTEVYAQDDEAVMVRGETIVNKVELVTQNDLSASWYITSKVPLYGENGDIVGLEGVTRPFSMATGILGAYSELSKAIAFVEKNYSQQIAVPDLAKAAGVTLRTFERQFKRRFKISPALYIKKVRINAACRELIHSNCTLAEVAAACGFCDQSHMTREFGRIMKVTPQVYRDTYSR